MISTYNWTSVHTVQFNTVIDARQVIATDAKPRKCNSRSLQILYISSKEQPVIWFYKKSEL